MQPHDNLNIFDQIKQFLDLLHPGINETDDLIEFRCFHDPKTSKDTFRRWYDTTDQAAKEASDFLIDNMRQRKLGFFVGVMARKAESRVQKKSSKNLICDGSTVWVDIDLKDINHDEDHLDQIIDSMSPTPSIIIRSGGGAHCYWLLDRRYPKIDIEDQNKALSKALHGDPQAVDCTRIIRLPYSYNCKPEHPNPVQASIQIMTDRRYTLAGIAKFYPPPANTLNFPRKSRAMAIPDTLQSMKPRPQLARSIERLMERDTTVVDLFHNRGLKTKDQSGSMYDIRLINKLLYSQIYVEDVADCIAKKLQSDGRAGKKPDRYIPHQINQEIQLLKNRGINVQYRPNTPNTPPTTVQAEPLEMEPIPLVALERYDKDHRDKEKRGKPRPSLMNCHALMKIRQMDEGFGYNEFSDQIEVNAVKKGDDGLPVIGADGKAETTKIMVHDSKITELRLDFAREWQVEFPKEKCMDVFLYVARQCSYNPVQDYLLEQASKYKLSDKIDRYTSEILNAKVPDQYTELVNKMGRYWLISGVARQLRPGCKADTAMILKGPQNAGKTSFFRVLCPDPKYFSNSKLDVRGGRDAYSSLRGVMIWEFGELAGMRKSDVEPLKNFLSNQEDRYCKKYERFETYQPRAVVFCGSTNNQEFLRDLTGDRRFWPIEVGDVDLEKLREWRDQLWADAVHLFQQGQQWWFTAEENQQLANYQMPFREQDTWATMIGNADLKEPNTAHQILRDVIGLTSAQQNRGAIMRLGSILSSMGWTKGRFTVHIFDWDLTPINGQMQKMKINERTAIRNAWRPPCK